ncbi:hypothetical protein PVAP13_3NG222148 [Panicum virgatum]|uniref:Uncharacterized protein n=1 Tax=Panicum virgatum TaxID=38727 RepID=A0A8T0UFC4_PANVG|nr:hypothetical protein PVAP13_3NG222148 [Panicum virgatum]
MGSISHVVCFCMIALFFISSVHGRQLSFLQDEGMERVNQHISTLDYPDPNTPPSFKRPPRSPPANKQFPEADEGIDKITQHISTLDYADPSPTPSPARPPIPYIPPANKQFPEAGGSRATEKHHDRRANLPQAEPPSSLQTTSGDWIPTDGLFGSPNLGTNLV